jgi:hypothetical protein
MSEKQEPTTSPPSTSSLPVSRAPTSVSLARELASRVLRAGFGFSSYALLASYDPESSSLRTSRPSLFGDSTLSSEDFPRAGMTRSGSLYELPISGLLTDEPDSSSLDGDESLWRTPLVHDSDSPGGTSVRGDKGKSPDGLASQVQWPTPQAHDAKSPRRQETIDSIRSRAGGGLRNLNEATTRRLWPTPMANDAENNAGPGQQRRNSPQLGVAVRWPTPTAGDANASGSRNLQGSQAHAGVSLTDAVLTGNSSTSRRELTLWPTPSATPYGSTNNGHPRDGRREEYATKGTPSLETIANDEGGLLNPDWTDALMGLPVGWTAAPSLPKVTGTRRCRSDGPPRPDKSSTRGSRRGRSRKSGTPPDESD